MSFGLTYACDAVRDALNTLSPLLDQAKAAKVLVMHWFSANEGHPIAVNAQSVYDQANNQNLVIFADDACTQWADKINQAASDLQGLLSSVGAGQTNFVPLTQNPYTPDANQPDTLSKLQPLFIAGAVAVVSITILPVLAEAVGWSKVVRKTRRSR